MKRKFFVMLTAAVIITIGFHITVAVKHLKNESISICLYPDPPDDNEPESDPPKQPSGGG